MASPPSSTPTSQTRPKRPGLIANALKNKTSYFQFFAMTGIFFLSLRSLGQKYRLQALEEDTSSLKHQHSSDLQRINQIRQDLLDEASLDTTGRFSAFLRVLFADQSFD